MMEPIFLFIQGCIIGLLIAAPVGPVGVLCIKKTINHGWFSGFVAGSGAAVADTFYGAIAAFGIVYISDFLIDHQFYLKITGGLILLCLGLKMLFDHQQNNLQQNTQDEENASTNANAFADFFSTLFITITNPGTVIAFLAVFAGLGYANYADQPILAFIMVCGVFIGSLGWWMGLSWSVSLFNHKIGANVQHKINLISANVILIFGVGIFVSIAI